MSLILNNKTSSIDYEKLTSLVEAWDDVNVQDEVR